MVLFDALIIGGGPAGLSTALALGRVCRSALVFDSRTYRNSGVQAMHTVLSRDGTNPEDFRAIAHAQMEKYPSIKFQQSNIISVKQTEVAPGYMGFQAIDSNDVAFFGKKLVLATGTEDVLPDIPGYKENWPAHIYQCLFCDGFEQKDYPIGVLSFQNPSPLSLVLMALPFNSDITIYSNGPVAEDTATQTALQTAFASKAKLDTRRIRKLINNGEGPEKGITIEFEEGGSVTLGMLLHKAPVVNRGQAMIKQLGLKTREGSGEIVIDPTFAETSVKGCFAAGDTSDLVKQVSLAMGGGVRAAAVVSLHLSNEAGAQNLAAANGTVKGSPE